MCQKAGVPAGSQSKHHLYDLRFPREKEGLRVSPGGVLAPLGLLNSFFAPFSELPDELVEYLHPSGISPAARASKKAP